MKKEEAIGKRKKAEKKTNHFSLAKRINSLSPMIPNFGCVPASLKRDEPSVEYNLSKVMLFLDKNDSKSLVNIIDVENDVGIIGFILDSILWRNKKLAEKIVEQINMDELLRKINTEDSLEKISFLVSRISWLNKELNIKFLEKFDITSLARKIDREQNLETICQALFDFYSCDEEKARKLLEEINFDILLEKVNLETDFEKIAMLIYNIYLIYGKDSEKAAIIIATKIKNEESLERVIELLFKLRLTKSRFEGKLYLLDIKRREQEPKNPLKKDETQKIGTEILGCTVKKIDLENLAIKINLEKRFEKIFELISELSKFNKETIIELLNKINLEHLVLKYEKEK
ncbi:MAG: hypothetical protein QW279_08855 [Candidatus Jordarchaeaceae archaeon]